MSHLKAGKRMLKVAVAAGEEGNGWPDGDGGVTVAETVGKDNAGDRLRIAVRARDVLPATGAVPLTPRCHRS